MNPRRLTFALGEAGRCHPAETNSSHPFPGLPPGVSTVSSDYLKTIKPRLGPSQGPSSADPERVGIKGKFLMRGKQHFCIQGPVGTEGGGCSSLPLPGWPMGTCCFQVAAWRLALPGRTRPKTPRGTVPPCADRMLMLKLTVVPPHGAAADLSRFATPNNGPRWAGGTRPSLQQRPERRCPLSIQHITISNEFY